MKSRRTASFRRAFAALPESVREQARVAYRRFRENPNHPSLRFKRVHSTEPVYSVRVGIGYRAVGTLDGDIMIRFRIGSHAEYDGLLSRR
ncbi:MAG: hypothetical protein ACRD3M_10515 [Thermoanaerobaculia bacterium]